MLARGPGPQDVEHEGECGEGGGLAWTWLSCASDAYTRIWRIMRNRPRTVKISPEPGLAKPLRTKNHTNCSPVAATLPPLSYLSMAAWALKGTSWASRLRNSYWTSGRSPPGLDHGMRPGIPLTVAAYLGTGTYQRRAPGPCEGRKGEPSLDRTSTSHRFILRI